VDGEAAAQGADSAPDALRQTAAWMERGGPVRQRKVSVTFYLEPEQLRALRHLAEERRVPQAVLLRQAIDMYLERTTLPSSAPRPATVGEATLEAEEGALGGDTPTPPGAPSSTTEDEPWRPGGRRLLAGGDET
jgi:predicted transcriptional regulator